MPDCRRTHPSHADSGILGRQKHAQVWGKADVCSRRRLPIWNKEDLHLRQKCLKKLLFGGVGGARTGKAVQARRNTAAVPLAQHPPTSEPHYWLQSKTGCWGQLCVAGAIKALPQRWPRTPIPVPAQHLGYGPLTHKCWLISQSL